MRLRSRALGSWILHSLSKIINHYFVVVAKSIIFDHHISYSWAFLPLETVVTWFEKQDVFITAVMQVFLPFCLCSLQIVL